MRSPDWKGKPEATPRLKRICLRRNHLPSDVRLARGLAVGLGADTWDMRAPPFAVCVP
jgi:hypothetical protein